MSGSTDGRSRQPPAPISEWIAAAVSTLLVLAVLGFLLNEALTRPTTPPLLIIRTDSVAETRAGHLVIFSLRNDGGETAAAVIVRGALLRDGETAEESEATVDYVPVGAERHGMLQFQANPAGYRLRLRVVGFDRP